jgi:hypothetical protein
MAFSQVRHSETFKAASNFDGTQFRIVELTSNAHEVELGAINQGYGVLQNHPQSGEAATVAVDGVSKVTGGAAVAVKDWITSAASGFALVVASGDAHAAQIQILGRALTAATSGSLFSMEIQKQFWTVVSGAAVPA